MDGTFLSSGVPPFAAAHPILAAGKEVRGFAHSKMGWALPQSRPPLRYGTAVQGLHPGVGFMA